MSDRISITTLERWTLDAPRFRLVVGSHRHGVWTAMFRVGYVSYACNESYESVEVKATTKREAILEAIDAVRLRLSEASSDLSTAEARVRGGES